MANRKIIKLKATNKKSVRPSTYGKYYPHTINGKDKYYWFTKAPAYTNIVRW